MIIKTIGHTLLIKMRLYRLIAKVAPIVMLTSILLVSIIPHFNESYEFQQPALKTKITPLQQPPEDYTIGWDNGVAVIYGRLSYQSILLASNCEDSKILDTVHYNLKQQPRTMAKNALFFCYRSILDLDTFIEQHSNASAYDGSSVKVSRSNYGIIRAALILQHTVSSRNITPRVFFDTYSSVNVIHPDVDYFQSVKELLQQTGIKWLPCPELSTNKLLHRAKKYANGLFWKFCLCELSKFIMLDQQNRNGNEILMGSGIQASTIKLLSPMKNPIENKVARVLYSFVDEFSVLEDHLHSSSTLYYPLSESKYVKAASYLIPGIAYFVATLAYLIVKGSYLIHEMWTSPCQEETTPYALILTALSVYCSWWEFSYWGSLIYTFWAGFVLRLILSFSQRRLGHHNLELLRIILCAFNAFMIEYAAVFAFPLSLLLIWTGNIMAFCPPRLSLVLAFLVPAAVAHQFLPMQLSNWAYFTMYPLSIWCTL